MSLLDLIIKTNWLITPDAFQQILKFSTREYDPVELAKVMHGDYQKYLGNNNQEALLKQDDEDLPGSYRSTFRNNIAIIPVTGPIIPRSSLMSLSGATSVTTLGKDFNLAMNNDAIDTIILNFDTPGGEVTGVSELAQMFYMARMNGKKKIVSYVYGLGASAGYWLAASSSEVWASNTAQVGSIGVVAGYLDTSKRDEKAGVSRVEVVSSVSPNKRLDPSSDEGRASIQKVVDDLAAIFVSTVALYRGVTEDKVLSDFGKGGVLIAQEAMDKGMIDRVGSMEELIDNNIINNSFTGGFMSLTIQQVKAEPAVYQAILDEGKTLANVDLDAKIKASKEEGYKSGVSDERARIQSIETIKAPGAEAIIVANKFTEGMTKEKVSAIILDKQEADRAAAAAGHQADATKLGEASLTISKESTDDPDAAALRTMVTNIVAGANNGK